MGSTYEAAVAVLSVERRAFHAGRGREMARGFLAWRANRLCDLAWERWSVAYEAGLPSEPRLYRELCAAEREAARFDGVA